MDYAKESLRLHGEWKGKIEVVTRVPAENKDDLSLAYTPGVAQPCLEIQKDVNKSYDLTRRWNMCLVVTDGSAILGLGNIGPEAGMPVMEGKCALFKAFGDVDAFPLCIKSNDVDEIVNTIYLISGSFGGVNLEDISAPRCFEIEKKLKEKCDIPIFHDDQHGTAIVVSAGLTNALRLVGKKFSEAKVVINGAGSAGISICKLLLELGIGDVVMVDRKGILAPGEEWMNPAQKEIAEKTNKEQLHGDLKAAMKGRDIFVGVSAPNIVTAEMVSTMADDAIVFAMANPTPEIMPDEARKGGARVIATGRSDFPNQINNVLVFPGVFRGAFDVRASDINEEMKIAAAKAIADLVEEGANVIISHSNGPQVGMIHTAMNEFGKAHPDYTFAPMSVCSAMSQGYIGYDLQNAIRAELLSRGIYKPVATILTQVVIDPYDEAFGEPEKIIGRVLNSEEAEAEEEKGNFVTETAEGEYRRILAAPKPQKIIELETIRTLANAGQVVIAAGGGGIPVMEQGIDLHGASAIIEKDLASELLAEELDADTLLILTSVEKVSLNKDTDSETLLGTVSVDDANKYIAENQFAAGSMLPKIEAAVSFASKGSGHRTIITDIAHAKDGYREKTGTIIK